MGPIRGFKRKKKAEKKVDQNVLAALLRSQPQPLDWWDEFSQRITGTIYTTVVYYTFAYFACFSVGSIFSVLWILCIEIAASCHVSFAAYEGIGWDFVAFDEI